MLSPHSNTLDILRWLTALTPLIGVMIFPVVVPLTMARFGISTGIATILILTLAWFVVMLRTSKTPH